MDVTGTAINKGRPLILPTKKKWFDMMWQGIKLEEYREIKPYYDTRFLHALGFPKTEDALVKGLLRQMGTLKLIEFIFRNGYSAKCPQFHAECSLSIGTGKEEWGAVPGREYYILGIKKKWQEFGGILSPVQNREEK